MTPRCKRLVRVALSAFAFAINSTATRPASAQEAPAPSNLEREFWTSTQQIGTEGAYRAYLSRFPGGFFAPLAAAAVAKGAGASTAGTTDGIDRSLHREQSRSDADGRRFDPARIAGPTGSSAITQQTGDVFYGPGPMTVGWLGAKKQVVVPAGRWVLLGAEDGQSGHATPIPLTALVLAKVEGVTFRSLLLVRFNSRTGNIRSTWTDAKACEDNPAAAPFAWHVVGPTTTQCVTSAFRAQSIAARTFSSSMWRTALQALTAAGGSVRSGPFLLTEMFYTGDASNYMKVSRIDFGVSLEGANAASGVDGQAPATDLSIAGRRKWAEAYSALAAIGYRKKIAEEELFAGGKPTMTSTPLPD